MDGGRLEIPDKIGQTCDESHYLDRVFTYEALYTFLCETECIISQRLLTAISDDVNDFDTLTLNHCLIE